ncbi:recombinase [Haemophilus influenzae biotype aegyptius]|uniref:Predicted recombinational DNA repair protein, RecE pathway n=1 Tax=Haemophilus influenzae F3047 TaxID=935897 RepID=A0AAV2U3B3_HAEIF|nr:recombinase RecT [Haemophilus influenzae]QEQ58450.1 recombinase [Haemophilus influenzae biotype aegyptius]QEQ65242.1 recombinase [Haemophilus influenzae biotype aegyptius]TMQ39179.1 recombinase [Haemophilus influenzae biotype aegyptius]TMQ40347.1 recombinase [Haemophilus influenzae biotype aegyptius]TMQ40713.1 recombinase [Haemophilus influenzae biotype aegyptius]
MTNQVQHQQNKQPPALKTFFESANVQNKIKELVGKNAATFATSVMQIANSNAMLKTADPMSIFNAACMAATLNLPLQNGLGFAYIVPFRNNNEKKTEAQFQIGYKGFIQLAQRSGQFKRLVALPVYKKQLIKKDFINGFEFDWEKEPEEGELPIGYYAYFKLVNDFSAELYMTHEEINAHAKKYSQTYRTYLDKKAKGQWAQSVWAENFEAMALKTVIKLLLSKQAPLSVEMQQAVLADQAVVKDVENQEFNYADNIQNAEFVAVVDDETFNNCKQSIANGETTLQELCDSGAYEFSQEQIAELEAIENGNVQAES